MGGKGEKGRGLNIHDTEHAAGSEACWRFLHASASGHGLCAEEIGALIGTGAYERDVRFSGREVLVAGEGYEGGFPSDLVVVFC